MEEKKHLSNCYIIDKDERGLLITMVSLILVTAIAVTGYLVFSVLSGDMTSENGLRAFLFLWIAVLLPMPGLIFNVFPYAYARYSFTKLGVSNDCKKWHREIFFVEPFFIAEIPLGFSRRYDFQNKNFIMLWRKDDKLPKKELNAFTAIRKYPVVFAPDNAETREFLRENIGMERIPEFPNRAYHPGRKLNMDE